MSRIYCYFRPVFRHRVPVVPRTVTTLTLVYLLPCSFYPDSLLLSHVSTVWILLPGFTYSMILLWVEFHTPSILLYKFRGSKKGNPKELADLVKPKVSQASPFAKRLARAIVVVVGKRNCTETRSSAAL